MCCLKLPEKPAAAAPLIPPGLVAAPTTTPTIPGRTGKTARRKLANKLVGILHGTLTHRTDYDKSLAWKHWQQDEEQLAA